MQRTKGARKSVYLNHTAPKFTPNLSASQSWSHPGTLHPGALGGGLHTHLLCTDLHQGQLSLGVPALSCSSLTVHSPHFLPPLTFALFPCHSGLTHNQVVPCPVQSPDPKWSVSTALMFEDRRQGPRFGIWASERPLSPMWGPTHS